MSEEDKTTSAYDLLRRVPPSKVEQRMYDIIKLNEELTDTLLTTVDCPLKLIKDDVANNEFIACEFNRDLDSHRSPISNQYFPALEDGQPIPERLRNMEIMANNAFNAYRHLYFQGGICSVYFWEIDENVFGVGVFVKNDIETELRGGQHIKGCIDCSDVFEVDETDRKAAVYTLTSSVLLKCDLDCGLSKPLTISGSTAARTTKTCAAPTDDDHIINIGKIVEDNSSSFRDRIEHIYIGKMKQIMDYIAKRDGRAQQQMMADAFQTAKAATQK